MTAVTTPITLDQLVARSDDVLFQEVGGEAVLLDLASEQYFGLDPVGTRIWALLDGRTPLQAVHAALCNEYDAAPDRVQADLLILAQSLLDAGLIKVG